jgi:hypothetical protein
MIKVSVDAGTCGFNSLVKVESDDGQNAKIGDTKTYELANKYCEHPACPVPCAIIKGIEAACGLALVKNATIKIIKE